MIPQDEKNIKMSENIIIVDGDYIDGVAFDLIVNFERMLDRKIHAADLSQWIVNIALDGRMREGKHETQVVFLHDKSQATLRHFQPAHYAKELNQQAFNDPYLGEFIINTIATGSAFAEKETVIRDLLQTILAHKEMRRIMVVPNADDKATWNQLKHLFDTPDADEKSITLFAMQPMEGGNFKQQILGYSLLNAMGITAEEINNKIK